MIFQPFVPERTSGKIRCKPQEQEKQYSNDFAFVALLSNTSQLKIKDHQLDDVRHVSLEKPSFVSDRAPRPINDIQTPRDVVEKKNLEEGTDNNKENIFPTVLQSKSEGYAILSAKKAQIMIKISGIFVFLVNENNILGVAWGWHRFRPLF